MHSHFAEFLGEQIPFPACGLAKHSAKMQVFAENCYALIGSQETGKSVNKRFFVALNPAFLVASRIYFRPHMRNKHGFFGAVFQSRRWLTECLVKKFLRSLEFLIFNGFKFFLVCKTTHNQHFTAKLQRVAVFPGPFESFRRKTENFAFIEYAGLSLNLIGIVAGQTKCLNIHQCRNKLLGVPSRLCHFFRDIKNIPAADINPAHIAVAESPVGNVGAAVFFSRIGVNRELVAVDHEDYRRAPQNFQRAADIVHEFFVLKQFIVGQTAV